MSDQGAVNAGQAELWNSAAGPTWVELQELLDRVLAPVAERVVATGFPGEGGQVLDLGCGSGATTLAMARRLGASGGCVGVDISQPLIDAAVRLAREADCATATFLRADAQTCRFEPARFDAAISRFGVMFFDDPEGAFRNIRRAMRPDGRLAFAAWRSPAENPFMTAAARAAEGLLPLPAPQPDDPGQFSFARADRVRGILESAGWREVSIEAADFPARLSASELLTYVSRMGPVGLALQALDAAARRTVLDAVSPAFEPFIQGGVARFDLACWLVTARA